MLPAPRIFKTWRFRAIITVAIFSLAVTILPSSASTQPLGESGQVRGGGWVDVALVGLPYESQVSIALTSNSNSLLKLQVERMLIMLLGLSNQVLKVLLNRFRLPILMSMLNNLVKI